MIMKKYHLLAAVAFVALAACTKNGQTNVPEVTDPLEDGTPVPVLFSAVSPSTGVQVKSVGAVDKAWSGQELKIYGYDRAVTDFTGEAFIDNVSATAPADGNKGAIEVHNNAAQNEPFYYVTGKYYDFYGYHIDDAATGEPVKTATSVSVPFELKGSQDLMLAKADQQTDIDAAGKTDEVNADKAYSAFSARRGVQPNLLFKHQLTRFTFEIVAGSEAGSNIYVTDVKIASKYKGSLEVVGQNRGLVGVADETAELSLMEKGVNGVQALTEVKPEAYVEGKTNYKAIGESIMVIPGETSYKLYVSTRQDGVTTEIAPQEWTLDIAKIEGAPEGATKFEAGYSYKVKIVIYGLEEVKITAELEDWKEGGSTVLDPDLM